MRYIILALALLVSTEAFSKRDWCNFNADFALEYKKARDKYAFRIKQKREGNLSLKELEDIRNGVGRWRAKTSSSKWGQKSLSKQTDEVFKGIETEFTSTTTGKVIIRPKNLVEGQKVKQIVYDTSGDYFRVEVGTVKNGRFKPPRNWKSQYLDSNGNVPQMPSGISDDAWIEMLGNSTHFRAAP